MPEKISIPGLPLDIVPFDSSRLGPRPGLFLGAAEIERARRRIQQDPSVQGYQRLLEDAADRAELVCEAGDDSWWEAIREKPWAETYPPVFENTIHRLLPCALDASTCATLWLLTDDARYADRGCDRMMGLAPYSFVAEHYDVGMNYAIWGLFILMAYDALAPRMSPMEQRHMDAFFTRLAVAVARNDDYWIEHNVGGGVNNHIAWHKMILGLLGLFYGQEELVRFCLSGRWSMPEMLGDGLLDDGLWIESSLNYHFTAIVPMAIFADCQQRVGHEPALINMTAHNGRNLKQPFDAFFNVLAPDGMIPPVGDAYGNHQRIWDLSIYEYAWGMWQDPHYAWVLRQEGRRTGRSLFLPPMPAEGGLPAVRTALLPEHGYAFLRSHRDAEYWNTDAWCAFLTYDRSGIHSNADKLSLMLFGQKRMLLSDVEARATVPHAFSSRVQGELNRSTLSHNTVMIDNHDQRSHFRLLRLVEFRDVPDEKRVTAADEEGLLYDGVKQFRTLCMTPDYVLDVFQVDCGERERQIDWLAHVMNEEAAARPELNPILEELSPFDLPQAGPWRWLREARSAVVEESLRMEWRAEDARLRLLLLGEPGQRLILCGYPATDEDSPPLIPMLIARRQAARATFVALWLIGEGPREASVQPLPPLAHAFAFEVTCDGRTRRHTLPRIDVPNHFPA